MVDLQDNYNKSIRIELTRYKNNFDAVVVVLNERRLIACPKNKLLIAKGRSLKCRAGYCAFVHSRGIDFVRVFSDL